MGGVKILLQVVLSGEPTEPTLQNPLESDGHGEPALQVDVSDDNSATLQGGDGTEGNVPTLL